MHKQNFKPKKIEELKGKDKKEDQLTNQKLWKEYE
jgi:hypothetical protein